MPPENPFLKLFGSSPVRPLQAHMSKVIACVNELAPFFEAVERGDTEAIGEIQKRIVRLENEADALKHELRLNLPKNLLLPVARRDVLEVLRMQDQIANRAKDIAGLVKGRAMRLPPAIVEDFKLFVRRGLDTCHQAQTAINELDELVETGFGGGEVRLVQRMLAELNRLERETDEIQVRVRDQLFAIERDLNPVDVMFLYQLIDWTGDLGDRAQRVGSRLQLMLAS